MLTEIDALMGGAGTGKSTLIGQRMKDNPRQFRLTATTGIAAINMSSGVKGEGGVVTINSELKFFDTESMEESYADGGLHKELKKVRSRGKTLVIDEISMMNAKQFDLLVRAMDEVNATAEMKARGGLGLLVVGDFCQLSPVPTKGFRADHPINKFAFEGDVWKSGRVKVEKLTKIWRQSDPQFMAALQAARCGDGKLSADILHDLGGVFTHNYDPSFEGVTILPTNKEVDKLNYVRLQQLLDNGAKRINFSSFRWGTQRGEWRQNIPERLELAEGAYVMIYVNDSERGIDGQIRYANGSTGYIRDADDKSATVELLNGTEVIISKVTRLVYEKKNGDEEVEDVDSYDEWLDHQLGLSSKTEKQAKAEYRQFLREMTAAKMFKPDETPRPYFDYEKRKWVMGAVTYMPLRLAYASTVHKTQGLTLDRVQINPVNRWFENPAMAYVAMSRVRDWRQLKIVGGEKLWEERCNAAAEVMEWV